MACEKPLVIKNPRYNEANIDYWREYFKDIYNMDFLPDRSISIPCGKCGSCLRSRMNSYRLRLLYEYERYPNSLFITLTFDGYYVKLFKRDYNRAVRLFLDRLRKKYGKGIRHFIIGEYGEKNGRFHYHGILFNVPFKRYDYPTLQSLWKYGLFHCGLLKPGGIHYVVKYITKEDPNGFQKIPRLIISKGLGESFLESSEAKFAKANNKSYIVTGGKIVPLSRYYLTKLYDYDERILNQLCSKYEPFKRLVDGKYYYDELSYRNALKVYSEKMEGLGLSKKSLNLPFRTSLEPIHSESLHLLDPWDQFDFNTKTELEKINSCFDLNPF